jgi:hypothetical protein
VLITGQVTPKEIETILNGIDIGRGEKTDPISLKILSKNGDSAWVEVSCSRKAKIEKLGAFLRP